jgi:acyl carrier protein
MQEELTLKGNLGFVSEQQGLDSLDLMALVLLSFKLDF